jgi:hypothetical protein
MEQIMACLLAEIRTSQAKTDTILKEMKEMMARLEVMIINKKIWNQTTKNGCLSRKDGSQDRHE